MIYNRSRAVPLRNVIPIRVLCKNIHYRGTVTHLVIDIDFPNAKKKKKNNGLITILSVWFNGLCSYISLKEKFDIKYERTLHECVQITLSHKCASYTHSDTRV